MIRAYFNDGVLIGRGANHQIVDQLALQSLERYESAIAELCPLGKYPPRKVK